MFTSANRVLWTQGMLMSPQHLQQLEMYQDRSREDRLQSLVPNAWGISRLTIDEAALRQGAVEVVDLAICFPSGLLATLRSQDTLDPGAPGRLRRTVGDSLNPSASKTKVFVAIAPFREGAANVASVVPGAAPLGHQRFVAKRWLVAEASEGATPAVEVAYAVPHLQLLFESELAPDMEALCIGEVGRDASGALAWADDFVPPCLHIGVSRYVMGELGRLLSLLAARQRHLAALCKHRRAASQPLQVADLLHFNALSAVRAALPLLHELLAAPLLSPYAASLLLKQIIGHLSASAAAYCEEPLPPPQHRDLRAFFRAAFAAIEHLVNDGGNGQHERVALAWQADGFFGRERLAPKWLGERTWLLAVRQHSATGEVQDMADLGAQWTKFARIASLGALPHLVQVAALGVPLRFVERPPAGILWDAHTLYFALDTAHDAWQEVAREQAVGVALPPSVPRQDIADIALLVTPEADRWVGPPRGQ